MAQHLYYLKLSIVVLKTTQRVITLERYCLKYERNAGFKIQTFVQYVTNYIIYYQLFFSLSYFTTYTIKLVHSQIRLQKALRRLEWICTVCKGHRHRCFIKAVQWFWRYRYLKGFYHVFMCVWYSFLHAVRSGK